MRSYGGNEDTVDAMREGLYRLARREGLAAVTVRGPAESGLSVSAIRHWDSHHARIRAHALAHLVWRRRSIHAEVPFLRSDDALGALCALLRLASERRADHEVWLAYASAARVEEVLREIVADANREQRQVLGRFLGREPDDPVVIATQALVDGLASMLCDPADPITEDQAVEALRLAYAP